MSDDDSFNDSEFDDGWDDEEDGDDPETGPRPPVVFDRVETEMKLPAHDLDGGEDLSSECISNDAMEEEMATLVQQVATALELKENVAASLLRTFNWSKDKLVEKYTDGPKACLRRAGLDLVHLNDPSPPKSSAHMECAMCMEDISINDTFALGCGHRFCVECWQDYLANRISSTADRCVLTECPAQFCHTLVTDDVVGRFVPREVLMSYNRFRRRNFVSTQRHIKWCPSPGCDVAIRELKPLSWPTANVTCSSCANKWCFACYTECHDPVSCQQLETWLEKVDRESDSAQWIINNTKKCTKCSTRIEKNQGCNHMVCTKCKHEFCWVCMGDWADHGNKTGGFYKCNKYQAKKEYDKGPKTDGKAEIDRFLHYYHRYHNHEQSKMYAARYATKVASRMAKMHKESGGSRLWIGVQFLKDAADEVIRARQILKYTYVYGFWLAEGPEKELFEFLQQDLEKNTEHLHWLTEQEKPDQGPIVDQATKTAAFAQKLLDGLMMGLTKCE